MLRQALRAVLPDRAAFTVLAKVLERAVQYGTLVVLDPWDGRHVFGTGEAPFATVRLTDPEEPARLLASPSLRAGEAYMDGGLVVQEGSLRDFLLIAVAAAEALTKEAQTLRAFAAPVQKLQRHNPVERARVNVAHHYDLSKELYKLFLDEDLQYSCAYFQTGDETLDEAQAKKKSHLAAKLCLESGARVLDIGSGWGGLALDLAQRHGVEVDGLTLSQEQLAVAQARVHEEGLDDRVRFHLQDYRHSTGTFDRIVSVGMFEHVGEPHFGEFFDVIRRRLAPDGLAVIHAIGHRNPPGDSDPWIDKYIFPGGYCPSLSEVLASVEKSDLWVTDVEILRLHYAETLQRWSERFQARRAQAAALYDERFCRMWEYYLAVCEAAFRVGGLMVFQIQLARRVTAAPLTRDYMVDNERRQAADLLG
ncbi:cyclopropane-fatty-acyl-phospholipid synthase [Phenylobacterium haematophilum]|uniref:Cyclopropane-fatty-acyl-phospholipid synthase n=1 Tax=Phenylobacterium haematophilum TaxID=98513 RepID=A0A840A3V6_9CAUL|nr:cyclopropane-fatty-acyl-phospholipid synthase family protein [Phenylobacterium haematophilum]MBB3892994.1 cyclopropane-fatty-acyl-phospholipid synthase [Phenylobacterium haematophilum]